MLRGALLVVGADDIAPRLGTCRVMDDDGGGVNVRQPGRVDDIEFEELPPWLEFNPRDACDAPEFAGLLKLVIDGVLGDILDRTPCTFAAVLPRDGVKNRCELGGTFRIDEGFTARFVGL